MRQREEGEEEGKGYPLNSSEGLWSLPSVLEQLEASSLDSIFLAWQVQPSVLGTLTPADSFIPLIIMEACLINVALWLIWMVASLISSVALLMALASASEVAVWVEALQGSSLALVAVEATASAAASKESSLALFSMIEVEEGEEEEEDGVDDRQVSLDRQ